MMISAPALSRPENNGSLNALDVAARMAPVKKLLSRAERDSELSIRTRKFPAYDPRNIRFGEFIFAPSLTTSAEYQDNVYATGHNTENDFLYAIRPALNVSTDLPLHQINAGFYYEDGEYKKLKQENYDDYGASIDARYDIHPGMSVPLAVGYVQTHSRRDDPEDRTSADPLVFKVLSTGTGAKMTGDKVELTVGTGFQEIKYDDTTSFSGLKIDNRDRNRRVFSNFLTFGLPQEAYIAPFAYASHRLTTYEIKRDAFGFQRDSYDLEGGLGSYFNFSDVTRSSFRIGWVNRKFDSSVFDPISALTYQADINWDATSLISFLLTGERKVRETSIDASSQVESSAYLSLLYELAPNLILKPRLGYVKNDYRNSDFETDSYKYEMQADYKIDPNIWALFGYQGISQTQKGGTGSALAAQDGFEDNLFSFSLKFQL